jgi:site-specific DNA recombinase
MEDLIKLKDVKYGRTSTDDQRSSQTIENQKMELGKYSDFNNLNIVDEYWDDGESSSKPFNERPEGRRLLDEAKNKKFDRVWVCKVDRFGRDVLDSLITIKELKKYNVELKSINENTDDRFTLTLLFALAEKERDTIRYRSMLGKVRAIQNGKWIGGLPPYAYKINSETKKLELYEDKLLVYGKYSEVDVIRKIFYLCVYNKLSSEKIAIILNKEGIPPYTPGKNKISKNRVKASLWTGARVRNLIKEEVYKGTYTLGRRSSNKDLPKTIQVPAIVSVEEWSIAQEVLKSNIIKSTRHAKRTYLLSGIILCGECKNKYHGLLSHTTYYYGCGKHRFKGNDNPTKCKNKHLNAKVVENEVWADVKKFILEPELIKSFLEERRKELEANDYKKKLKEVEIKISSFEKKKQKYTLILGIEDNPIVEDIKVEFEKIKNEEVALFDEKRFYEGILSQENYEKNKIDEVTSMLNKMIAIIENPTDAHKKEIIGILVDKIIVYAVDIQTNKRKVEIYYSFSKDGITKLTLIE